MINLNLELEELNAILKHLGNGIYTEVGQLIAKLHGQALPQVQKPEVPAETTVSAE
jgi:hypothetical protein